MTQLLRRSRQGDQDATDHLLSAVYDHLHALAARYMSRERPGHTLSPTALVHEAYLKLAATGDEWEDRSHFFAIASRSMRQILVDHARSRNRIKRGSGGQRVTLDRIDLPDPNSTATILDLDEALTSFALQDERKAKLMEMLYFGGLTYEEAAEALSISTVTVHRYVKVSKAWLRSFLVSHETR
jgi:RNA polymerase sigma-70 factor, ECF subfamily